MFRIAVVIGLLALSSASAQSMSSRRSNGNGKVHRMQVINGLTQNVRYFGSALTPDESSTVRELERLENEMAYVRGLIALKEEYVASDRALEPHRRAVQLSLYGVDITQSSYGMGSYGYGYGGRGYFGGFAYPSYGNYYGPSVAMGGGSRTVNYSLANGVGDEGVVKTAMARTLAQQATPEYAAALERQYDRVVTRAETSPTLRVALGLPQAEDTLRERERIAKQERQTDQIMRGTPAAPRPIRAPYVLTLKSGEVVLGKTMLEKNEWIIVERVSGGRVRLRTSEVVRIDENPTIRGAAD